MRVFIIILACLATSLLATGASADPVPIGLTASDLPALEAATKDACDKRVAILGEIGTHGDGHAIAFKAALTHRLLTQCGFKAMVWESSFYEFDHLDHLVNEGASLTRDQVAAAIGGIWNRDVAVQPLIDELTERANARTLTLGGVDDIWDMAGMPYSTDVLPKTLASRLPAVEATACADAFQARIYNGDISGHSQLLNCLAHIRTTIDIGDRRNLDLLDSLTRYIDNDGQPPAIADAQTEHSMYLNFKTLLDRLPIGHKVIVWTATVHGGRISLAADGAAVERMGGYIHDALGNGSLTIAFGAAGGSYGQAFDNTAHLIAPPPAESVEARALAGSHETAVYVPFSRLKSFGIAPAGLSRHTPLSTRDWSETVDAAVIFREEYPVAHVRVAAGS